MITLRFALASLLLAALARAQMPSVWHIDSDYHFGSIEMFVPNPGSMPSAVAGFLASRGILDLDADDTWSLSATDHEVLADLTVTNQPDSASGTYRILPDSRMLFDANPANPGTDVLEAMIGRDHRNVILSTRNTATETGWLQVAIEASTNRTNAALAGTYRIASFGFEYEPAGVLSITLAGTATFDGAGSVTINAQEQEVDPLGVQTLAPINFTGAYNVAPNGAVQLGPTASGGVSLDGEFFFAVDFDPTSAFGHLLVGVEIPATNDLTTIQGDWAAFGKTVEGHVVNGPRTSTRWSLVEVTASSPSSGAFSLDGNETTSDALGASVTPLAIAGTVAAAGPNRHTFTVGGQGSQTLDFSPSGTVMIANEFDGTANLMIGMRVCPGSGPYGTGTPGTGGSIPIATMEGFPVLGDPSFALGVLDALPFAPAGLLITLGDLPGVPLLGGTIWVDPGRLIAVPSRTVDSSGGARWSLTPPSDPIWLSHDLFTQVLVIDPGAPGGLAMSEGLRTSWCR